MMNGIAPRSKVVFLPNLSAIYAEGTGVSAEHKIIIDVIHDPWSSVIGMGLFALLSISKLGDGQP